MIEQPQKPKINPLTSYMRQPKIYIKLPSNGNFWNRDSIDLPDNSEFPVYSMTAKDELLFKTPDALMNGQAVVDVIQSCLPNIKNAWDCPNLDIDAILIAIRIATYGDIMNISHLVPGTNEETEHSIDLKILLDQINRDTVWENLVEVTPQLTCIVRPLTYRHMTRTNMKSFDIQKTMQYVGGLDIPDNEKIEILNKNIKELTDITVDLLMDSILAIQTPTDLVEDREFINEFVVNADADIIKKIQTHINNLKSKAGIKPIKIHSTPEEIAAGAPAEYELPIKMDNSDFFG
jgi:hypothetical protein